MFRKTRFLIAVFITLTVTACSGPFVLLPGGSLDGAVTPVPDDWSFTDEIDTIQLETNPADPYSVNIWVTAMGDHLYVHAGATRATWIEHMEADPNVRLRANDAIYELAASRVESQDEFDRYSTVYEKKYGNPPRNGSVVEAYLFRLGGR
jgi:hypothetical protein